MSGPTTTRRRRGGAIAVAGMFIALTLSGCAAAADGETVAGSNYVAGDGTVLEVIPENRTDPIRFTGTDEYGESFDSTQVDDRILVVNFWYAACPPCRTEAPILQALSEEFGDEGVQFVGVNVRDEASVAQTFAERFGVEYRSLIDRDAGVVLAFAGEMTPSAVPTTVVLDRQGRPAARVLGAVQEGTLRSLVRAVLDEDLQSSPAQSPSR
ncbi:TlpA family protein disulfide reductase [Naasia lichenicola]|uniref:TlpA family protein disulfide reductase n=1 Tax=Naasia lichenicola TaxID=2565933 RepID=A0A4S4FKV9_9MICO|nr:TlpA disulfide reductase family protein [Naasia lichenicola]THG31030.1 TlpA family protein disulfide reductase [Naasia lichenicola]